MIKSEKIHDCIFCVSDKICSHSNWKEYYLVDGILPDECPFGNIGRKILDKTKEEN